MSNLHVTQNAAPKLQRCRSICTQIFSYLESSIHLVLGFFAAPLLNISTSVLFLTAPGVGLLSPRPGLGLLAVLIDAGGEPAALGSS